MSLDNFIKQLSGRRCRAVVFGAGTGTVVGFGFGKRQRRVKPLSNPRLSEVDRKFASELELTVYCAWRLCRENRVVCGWRDSSDQSTAEELEELIGKKVVRALVQSGTYDLEIEFEGNEKFQLFCDVTNDDESDDNYLFATSKAIGSVGVKSKVAKTEKRVRTLRSIE